MLDGGRGDSLRELTVVHERHVSPNSEERYTDIGWPRTYLGTLDAWPDAQDKRSSRLGGKHGLRELSPVITYSSLNILQRMRQAREKKRLDLLQSKLREARERRNEIKRHEFHVRTAISRLRDEREETQALLDGISAEIERHTAALSEIYEHRVDLQVVVNLIREEYNEERTHYRDANDGQAVESASGVH